MPASPVLHDCCSYLPTAGQLLSSEYTVCQLARSAPIIAHYNSAQSFSCERSRTSNMKSLSSFVTAFKNREVTRRKSARQSTREPEEFISYLPGTQEVYPQTKPHHATRASRRASGTTLRSARSVPAFRDDRPGTAPASTSYRPRDAVHGQCALTMSNGISRASQDVDTWLPAPTRCWSPLTFDGSRVQGSRFLESFLSTTSERDYSEGVAIPPHLDQRPRARTGSSAQTPPSHQPVIPIIVLSDDEDVAGSPGRLLEPVGNCYAECVSDFLDLGGSNENDEDDCEEPENRYTVGTGLPEGEAGRRPRTASTTASHESLLSIRSSTLSKCSSASKDITLEMFPTPPPLIVPPPPRGLPPAIPLPFGTKPRPSTADALRQRPHTNRPKELRKSKSAGQLGRSGRQQPRLLEWEADLPPEKPAETTHTTSSSIITRDSTQSDSQAGGCDTSSTSTDSAPNTPSPRSGSFPYRTEVLAATEANHMMELVLATHESVKERTRMSMLSVSECGSIRWGVAV